LSSSASVILSYLSALAEANGLELEPRELIEHALRAEKDFVGVNVGILDPAAIVGSRRGHLLAIDTRETKWEVLPLGPEAPDYQILVVFSGITRNLSGTDYNQRVEECHHAARKLAALSGRVEVRGLDDLPESVFDEHGGKLLPPEARRARHFFTERSRVLRGRQLWKQGDLEGFGRLMKQSCESSINHWESGSPELIEIQRILLETEGVLGSRFSGAGWGGCCLALVDGGGADEILTSVQRKMAARLPELEGRSRVFLLESEDGLRIV
jgi:galactokinase/galacturonokinase